MAPEITEPGSADIVVSTPDDQPPAGQKDPLEIATAPSMEERPCALVDFLDNLFAERKYSKFSVVDDNARMHRTQSYYRIELTSSLPPYSKKEWKPQDPVVGSVSVHKDRWGLEKKNSSMSLENPRNNHFHHEDDIHALSDNNNKKKSSQHVLRKPHRRGSIDLDADFSSDNDNTFHISSPTGSTCTVEMAIEIATALTMQHEEREKARRKKKKRQEQRDRHYARNKKKRDSEKEKRRKERKARKKKRTRNKKEEADSPTSKPILMEDEFTKKKQAVKKGRRNPQKWETLLHRSESFGQSPAVSMKRKSAPSIFSPMCQSKAPPSRPFRTFSPPYVPRVLEQDSGDDDYDDKPSQANIMPPDLFHDDELPLDTDNNNNNNNITPKQETRRSVASYDAIYEMRKRPPVPSSSRATSEEEEEGNTDEDDFFDSSADELEIPLPQTSSEPLDCDSHRSHHTTDTSESEYSIPLPPDDSHRSNRTTDTATTGNNNMDASARSTFTTDTLEFKRQPPTHTNSFELTHRRSAVRHSMKRRVVKMTPEDLQSRIMDIQLTDEHGREIGGLKQDDDDDDDDIVDKDGDDYVQDAGYEEGQDVDGVPTLCDNDYTSSAEDEDFE